MTNRTQVAKALTTLRLAKKLKQEYVAAKLEISQSQLSKIEMGKKEFPLSKLFIYSEVLGIAPTEFTQQIWPI